MLADQLVLVGEGAMVAVAAAGLAWVSRAAERAPVVAEAGCVVAVMAQVASDLAVEEVRVQV